MLILTSHEAVTKAIERYSQTVPVEILKRYAVMLETEPIAWLFILQPGDRTEDLTQLRGQPFECWEYIERQASWYEAVFVISDDGFGHVVLIPDQPNIDPDLLAVCKANAVEAEG